MITTKYGNTWDGTQWVDAETRQPAYYRLFKVDADRNTGEWISDTLVEVGATPRAEHDRREDTSEVHFDTFEVSGTNCAVMVHWVD